MRHLITVVALLCVVSTTAMAGDIPSVGITSANPDGTQPTSTTLQGEIPTSGSSYEIADTALDLMQMLIGVGI